MCAALQNHRMKKVNLQRVRQRQKNETQHSRYRHLYQARRLTGDIISQVNGIWASQGWCDLGLKFKIRGKYKIHQLRRPKAWAPQLQSGLYTSGVKVMIKSRFTGDVEQNQWNRNVWHEHPCYMSSNMKTQRYPYSKSLSINQ